MTLHRLLKAQQHLNSVTTLSTLFAKNSSQKSLKDWITVYLNNRVIGSNQPPRAKSFRYAKRGI